MKNEIITALLEASSYVSGEALSQRFGVSRAAISKAMHALAEAGLPIESTKHHGYRLTEIPDLLLGPVIAHALRQHGALRFASAVHAWPTIDSTNLAARRGAEAGDPDGVLYIAEEQTAGRGRRGKSWLSAQGEGLWFSILLRPDLPPDGLARITLFAGLCVATALREMTGLDVRLKWPNDLVVLPHGRKLGGILTEMMVEENHVSAVIVGIGINVGIREFPSELTPVATSLRVASSEGQTREQATGNPAQIPGRVAILAAILKEFEQRWPDFGKLVPASPAGAEADPVWLNEYRSICATLGQPVCVTDARGESRRGLAIEVAPSGDLVVRWEEGGESAVSAGDVSVRGLLGYA